MGGDRHRPGRAEAAITDHNDGTYTVRHCCTTSGRYRLSVRLADLHLTGSPLRSTCGTPTPTALGLAAAEATMSAVAAARHTVLGLFSRWRAYLPLARLWRTRNRAHGRGQCAHDAAPWPSGL